MRPTSALLLTILTFICLALASGQYTTKATNEIITEPLADEASFTLTPFTTRNIRTFSVSLTKLANADKFSVIVIHSPDGLIKEVPGFGEVKCKFGDQAIETLTIDEHEFFLIFDFKPNESYIVDCPGFMMDFSTHLNKELTITVMTPDEKFSIDTIVGPINDPIPFGKDFIATYLPRKDENEIIIRNERKFYLTIKSLDIGITSPLRLTPSKPLFKLEDTQDPTEPIKCLVGTTPTETIINPETNAIEIAYTGAMSTGDTLLILCPHIYIDFSTVLGEEWEISLELQNSKDYKSTVLVTPVNDPRHIADKFLIDLTLRTDEIGKVLPNQRLFKVALTPMLINLGTPFRLTPSKAIFKIDPNIDSTKPLTCLIGTHSYPALINNETGSLDIAFSGSANPGTTLNLFCNALYLDFIGPSFNRLIDIKFQIQSTQEYGNILYINPINDTPGPDPEPVDDKFCKNFTIDLQNETDTAGNLIPNQRLFTFKAFSLNKEILTPIKILSGRNVIRHKPGATTNTCTLNGISTQVILDTKTGSLELPISTPIPKGRDVIITCPDFHLDFTENRGVSIPISIFEVGKEDKATKSQIGPIDDEDSTEKLVEQLLITLVDHKDSKGKTIGKNTREFEIEGKKLLIGLNQDIIISIHGTGPKDQKIVQQKIFKKREKSTTTQCSINNSVIIATHNEEKGTLIMKPKDLIPIGTNFKISCSDFYIDFTPVIDYKDLSLRVALLDDGTVSSSINIDPPKDKSSGHYGAIIAILIVALAILGGFLLWKFVLNKKNNNNQQEPLIGDSDGAYTF